MANDKVSIWNGLLKFGRKPATGELLVGNGTDFDLVNAGISDVGGVLTFDGPIAANGQIESLTGGFKFPDDTVQTTAATSYSPPSILLVANGGTGANTLTANNVVLGNGTDAVQFVAPGTSGNVLQSNGTTWTSTPVSFGRTLLTTLTTTSGTNATYTGISTTAYTALAFVLIGVSHSSATAQALQMQLTENNGSTWLTAVALTGSVASTGAPSGPIEIYNTKTSLNKIGFFAYANTVTSVTVTSTAPINGVRFNWSLSASFDAGTILIYGIP